MKKRFIRLGLTLVLDALLAGAAGMVVAMVLIELWRMVIGM